MKVILAVDPVFPPLTGIGRYTLELARRLSRLHDIEAVRFYARGRWIVEPDSLLKVSNKGAASRRLLSRSRTAVALYGPLYTLISQLRLRQYSDFIFHSPNFLLPPFPGKSVATFHDLSMYRHPEFHPAARIALLHREIPKALKRADHLIADSAFIADEISEYLGFPRTSISVVPCGVSPDYHQRDPDEIRPVLDRYDLSPNGYVLSVSTIEPRKNIGTLVAAYSGIKPEVRNRFPLVLCGDRGWRSEGLHQAIEDARGAGWLKYLGYVPEADLPLIYAGARALVYVPYYEGFGLPVLEAMASGVPVVCSNRSALPELCGDSACLVDPEDREAIRDMIHQVLEDDEWRSTARAAGLRTAGKYTWENSARSVINAYERAIEG